MDHSFCGTYQQKLCFVFWMNLQPQGCKLGEALFPQCLWGMEHLVPTRTFRRGLTLSTLGWVEGPVEVTPEFLVVLSVDQLEDALVHNICLEKKTAE